MSEDTFVREVNEELREDRIKGLWNRFGNVVIAAAVLVVLGTAGYRGWEYWTQRQAGQSGDAYLSALELSAQGKGDEAIAALEKLSAGGSGSYPALARLRIAGEKQNKGDPAAALADFDALANDASLDKPLRDIARLRAGLIAVDREDYAKVKERLAPLAAGGQTYRSMAREALGLAAWKAGAFEEAATWFKQIVDDATQTGSVRNRATVMLDLLAGKGVAGAS